MTISRALISVSTNWLRERLGTQLQLKATKNLRVLDTSFVIDKSEDTYELYRSEHIPQSLHFDIYKCANCTPQLTVNLPEINCFTNQLQNLGIWPDSHVVVYDRYGPIAAYRAWWMFRLYGHKNVSVLDGGLAKWLSDGFEVTKDEPEVEKSDIVPILNKNLLHNYDDMMDVYNRKNAQIVDARPRNHPSIIEDEDGGVIPGSKHVGFPTLFNEDTTMKSDADLQALFDSAGVNLKKPLVSTCLRGLTACAVVAAAQRLGKENVPMYYGSWTEWRQRAPEEKKEKIDF